METPEDTLRAYQEMERSETTYSSPDKDPQFDQAMNLLLTLQEKYGSRRLRESVLKDYRQKWIKLFLTTA